jgi:hypothetical protein
MIDTSGQTWAALFRCLDDLPHEQVARVLDIDLEQARRAQILASEYVAERQRRADEEFLRRYRIARITEENLG